MEARLASMNKQNPDLKKVQSHFELQKLLACTEENFSISFREVVQATHSLVFQKLVSFEVPRNTFP